jgi:hypothetical protein
MCDLRLSHRWFTEDIGILWCDAQAKSDKQTDDVRRQSKNVWQLFCDRFLTRPLLHNVSTLNQCRKVTLITDGIWFGTLRVKGLICSATTSLETLTPRGGTCRNKTARIFAAFLYQRSKELPQSDWLLFIPPRATTVPAVTNRVSLSTPKEISPRVHLWARPGPADSREPAVCSC